MPSDFVDEVSNALSGAFETRTTDHRRGRAILSSVADREIVHVLCQTQSRPLDHQAIGPDEQHVEDGAGEDRTRDDGCIGRDGLRHRHPQSHTSLKAEDQ